MKSLLLAAAMFAMISSQAQGVATLVLVHGKVWTENAQQPEAEAIAIFGNKILAVGDSAAMLKLASPTAKIIDLHGQRVVPGFNDAHVHFLDGGGALASVQLRDATSQQEFRRRVAEFAKTRVKGEWILRGEWDHEKWQPAVMPAHQLIDDVTPDNPVYVERLDGHSGLANALAMKLAGVDKNTKDVPGGVIVRDAEGNPTGIFKDAAQSLIEKVIPPPTLAQAEEAILAAQRYAAANGVTSVQDMYTPPRAVRVYETMQREGKLAVRISIHEPLPQWHLQADAGIQAGVGNEMLRVGALKGFADGSLGSTTAWLFEPYVDSPQSSGIPSGELSNPEQMYANIKGADQAGLAIAIHAIGDRANHTILDFYERLEKEDGLRDRRLRIEHAQHLLASDIPRFAQLHVIASMQPYHLMDDGRWAVKRIGTERIKTSYAWRALLDSGAVLAFGSDWPVAPMEPLQGIFAAATRRTLDGKNPNGWVPEQKITVAEAVHAYTVGAAYAEFQEKDKGSLEAGKLADLVVLSDDIFHIAPEQIEKTRVEMTVFDGKVIYEKK